LDGRPLAELKLTEALADVLWHLDTGDTAASMRHLASLLNCDPLNVTFLVDRLEERGLVERQTDPADRRVKLVGLTTAGVHIRNQIVRQPPPDHHWRNSPPQTSSGCTISWQRQPASQANKRRLNDRTTVKSVSPNSTAGILAKQRILGLGRDA